MTFSRLLSRAVLINRAGSRSAFTSSKTDTANPNWLQVGLAFGTSAFIWGLLFKQHSTDVHEYEVKKAFSDLHRRQEAFGSALLETSASVPCTPQPELCKIQ